jgi:dihydroorotate dehydrogenase (NAD+) catalytic subunit
MSASDALEFLLAGACAVQIGTASFIDPQASVKILDGIENFLVKNGFSDIKEIVGYINRNN